MKYTVAYLMQNILLLNIILAIFSDSNIIAKPIILHILRPCYDITTKFILRIGSLVKALGLNNILFGNYNKLIDRY